jgi:hypothetical protein
MIKITVDEAYAFDYYSILELKYANGYIPKSHLEKTKEDIRIEIGIDLTHKILHSTEYENLKHANLLTFEAVDKAKTDEVAASYVDKCNYQRMLANKDLQNAFFNTQLQETKIGYDKHNANQ